MEKKAADPVEYDQFVLKYTDRIVSITVYNRGMSLMLTDDDRLRRIHRVLVKCVPYLEG